MCISQGPLGRTFAYYPIATMNRGYSIMAPRVASVMLLLAGLMSGNPGVSNVCAQTVDELRAEFDQKLRELRQEFENKLREAIEKERAKARAERGQQEAAPAAKKDLDANLPAELGSAPMPPAASSPPLGFFLGLEFSSMGSWGLASDYAARNTPGSLAPRPLGRLRTVDVDRDFAAIPTLGYYLPEGRGLLSASFYHLDAIGRDSFRAPGEVVMLGAPPDVGTATGLFFADSANASNRLRIDQLDARYQYPIQIHRAFTLTPEAGIRGLWLKNNVRSSYFTDAGGFFFSLDRQFDSWAIGPKIGIGGSWEFIRNFTLSAGGSGGYLLGRATARQVFCRGDSFGSSGCGLSHTFKLTESRGFPFVEGEFALNYALGANTRWSGLSASVGYRIGAFFDLVTRHREVGDETLNQIITIRLNSTYDSIFFRLQYLW